MRIDAHVHGDPDALVGDPATYVDACRAHGIERVVLIEPLDTCLRAVKRFGDFVIPVARIDMDHDGPDMVARCIDAGCRGIKFIRPAVPYGDERYWPLYAKLESLASTAIFHTGYLGFHGREAQPVHMEYMRAAQIDVVARRFPDLQILMAHFSNPWWEEAWKIALSNANVYADLSGGTAILRDTSMWARIFAPNGEVLEESVRTLCFASDVRYFEAEQYPFERYIRFYERILNRIELSEALRERVNRGNARLLFGG